MCIIIHVYMCVYRDVRVMYLLAGTVAILYMHVVVSSMYVVSACMHDNVEKLP